MTIPPRCIRRLFYRAHGRLASRQFEGTEGPVTRAALRVVRSCIDWFEGRDWKRTSGADRE